MVFQNYALYPHMTVFNNMAFALKLRRVPKADIERRVLEAARLPLALAEGAAEAVSVRVAEGEPLAAGEGTR
jgi:ABC-type Fe3+/spermidine/putrescine transport system ATPase subunit